VLARVARKPLFLAAPVSVIEPSRHSPCFAFRQVFATEHDRIAVGVPDTPPIWLVGWPDDVAICVLHIRKDDAAHDTYQSEIVVKCR